MSRTRVLEIAPVNLRRTCLPMSSLYNSIRTSTIIWPVRHRNPMQRKVKASSRIWARVQAVNWLGMVSQWMPTMRWRSYRMALSMATCRMEALAVMHGWEVEALAEGILPRVLNHCSTRTKSITLKSHSMLHRLSRGPKRMDSVEIGSSFRGCPLARRLTGRTIAIIRAAQWFDFAYITNPYKTTPPINFKVIIIDSQKMHLLKI